MSCSGCRVLRKGCSDSCVLRTSISFIEGAEAQGHATVFVAKFFGRAGLLSSLSSIPESQRSALFRSLLYEACGRSVNPITGSVGLLWSGNWDACEAAVETVLHGGVPRPISTLNCAYADGLYELKAQKLNFIKRERSIASCDDLGLRLSTKSRNLNEGGDMKRREGTPSDESEMTSQDSRGGDRRRVKEQPQLLNLFV